MTSESHYIAGYFYINFTQNFNSDRYYLAFVAILDELGTPLRKAAL